MDYLQIDAVKYSSKASDTAEFTSMTVGKLVEKLKQYDPGLPVVIKTGWDEYGLVGQVDER